MWLILWCCLYVSLYCVLGRTICERWIGKDFSGRCSGLLEKNTRIYLTELRESTRSSLRIADVQADIRQGTFLMALDHPSRHEATSAKKFRYAVFIINLRFLFKFPIFHSHILLLTLSTVLHNYTSLWWWPCFPFHCSRNDPTSSYWKVICMGCSHKTEKVEPTGFWSNC
jgi:hypothetical protein